MRVTRRARLLIFIPLVTGAISTILLLIQGGFGGGHGSYDSVITALGFPSIMLISSLALPRSVNIPDVLLVVWIPAALNMLGLFLLGTILSKSP